MYQIWFLGVDFKISPQNWGFTYWTYLFLQGYEQQKLTSDVVVPILTWVKYFLPMKLMFPESFRSLEPIHASQLPFEYIKVSHCLPTMAIFLLPGLLDDELGEATKTGKEGWVGQPRLAKGQQTWPAQYFSFWNSLVKYPLFDYNCNKSLYFLGINFTFKYILYKTFST